MDGSDVLSSVGQQPGRPARPLRRGRARDRQPGPPRAAHPGGRRGARRGRHRATPRRRRRRHRRARADRRAAGRGQRGQGAGAGLGRALRRRQPPRGPPVRRLARGARPGAAARRAARVGRPHAADPDGGPRPVPPARPDHRRRRRRGVRQGRPLPRARLSRAARPSTGSPSTATPRPSPSPGRCSTTARLLLQRAQDRRWSTTCASTPTWPPPTWPPRSRRRSSTCSSPRPAAPPPSRRRQGPGARPGAWPPTRCCAPACSRPCWPTGSAVPARAARCAPTTPGHGRRRRWWRLQRRPLAPRHRRPPGLRLPTL